MNVGEAIGIFSNIESENYTHKQKAEAIYIVMFQGRTKDVRKEAMGDVIKWLWKRCFRVRKNGEEHKQ